MAVAQPACISVQPADLPGDAAAITRIRRQVFIEEQRVPEELEWDPDEIACDWFVARADSEVVGIVRFLAEGRIGRMAVLPAWRRRGVGSALMQAVLAHARTLGHRQLVLSAQVHAIPFYSRSGFAATGSEYMDAGIPHRTMTLTWC
jgi:predicted GNAT family N-acyltransferase